MPHLLLTSRQCTCEATQKKTCITMAVGLFSEAETRGAVGLRFSGLFQILEFYVSKFPEKTGLFRQRTTKNGSCYSLQACGRWYGEVETSKKVRPTKSWVSIGSL